MATTATRPEGALYQESVNRKPLTAKMFYAKHLVTAMFGEAVTRRFGYETTLSITNSAKRFADFTGVSDWGIIRGAASQEADASTIPVDAAVGAAPNVAAADATANATAEATSRAWGVPSFMKTSMNSFHTHVWTPISTAAAPATAYVADNADWLVEVGGIAFVAALLNRAAQRRIKNAYVRNAASIVGGAAVVWGTKLALSYGGYAEPVAFAKTLDMGVRILGTQFFLKHATPLMQRALVIAQNAIDPFRAPFSSEKPLKARSA